MKIKSLIIPIATISAIATTSANANLLFDIYAGATLGAGGATIGENLTDRDKQDSFSAQSYGLVAGIDLPIFRVGAEYNFANIDRDLHIQTAFVNAYFKMPGLVVVNPYFGIGLGTVLDVNAHNVDVNHNMAYQAMAGLTFDIPALPIKIDAEAHTMYAREFISNKSANVDTDMLQYDLRLKLRYIF